MRIRKLLSSALAIASLIFGLGAQIASATVTVIVQPPTQVSFVGSNSTFTAQVIATAGETITSYTWKFSPNSAGPFSVINGAVNSVYNILNTQTNNDGYYFVSVGYNSGSTTGLTAVSTAVRLSVHDQARITSQPLGGLVRITGSNVTFSVGAAGLPPLSYQWRLNGTNLTDGGRISGATTNSITINNLFTSDSGAYDVVISNVYNTVISIPATVTVYAPPAIIAQPTNLAVIVGSNAVFQVVEQGSQPLTFSWQKNGTTTLTNGGRISGATTDTLTIANTVTNDAGDYTVTFSNPVGATSSFPATLTVLVPPVITSRTNATSQQGFPFTNYTVTATGSLPITFGADNLPAGLSLDFNTGIISGIPSVFGVFDVTLYATNAASVASTNLHLTLITDVPGVTSSTNVNGRQGTSFTYTITASNNPTFFSVVGLPPGINVNPTNGVISGFPLYAGTNIITVTAGNLYGSGSRNVRLNIANGVPVITSPLTTNGVENQGGFTYQIKASNTPTIYGAANLPTGLTVNTNTGLISGTLSFGGTNKVLIWAANAYGTGSNVLTIAVDYQQPSGLAITGVSYKYSTPYLLDFSFSLRDLSNNAVVRPPDQILIQAFEGDTNLEVMKPIPNETAFTVERAISKELLKTSFVLDYTYSMLVTSNAIPDMQAAVENLIDQEPATAQFSVYEFSADYVDPMLVTTNGFTADKGLVKQAIEGIQDNFVQGNYAGTRFYDALNAALSQFTPPTGGEEHFLIAMSDGYDDSSVLTGDTNTPNVLDILVNLAITNGVKIYCVGFGPNPNVSVLQYLTTNTQGNYYAATTAADLSTQFALLLKDLNSQYLLRWATLQRGSNPFQPAFQVTVDGQSTNYNMDFNTTNVTTVDTNTVPPTTNKSTIYLSLDGFYTNQLYAGDVRVGALDLFADADTNASSVTLNAFYIPRFIRALKVHYRANYPCTPVLLNSDGAGFLSGWSMTQTNDGTNADGTWLTLTSPNPADPTTSLPYGIMGDLVNFQFKYQALPTKQTAFSFFDVETNIYTNMLPGGQSFVLTNSEDFISIFAPTPPMGTPVPWLTSYGFTNDPAVDELLVTNGMPLWQWYLTGLNPTNPSNSFVLPPIQVPAPGRAPLITFNSAIGRTYRVDAAFQLGQWVTLQGNIAGTGFPISIPDNRNLLGVSSMYYRVVLTY